MYDIVDVPSFHWAMKSHTHTKQDKKIIFLIFQNVQTSSVTHPARYVMGTKGTFPKVRVAGV
jgi:hypothetical protein